LNTDNERVNTAIANENPAVKMGVSFMRGEPSAAVVVDTVGCTVRFGVVPRYSVVDIETILLV